jgi:hypothetical protein
MIDQDAKFAREEERDHFVSNDPDYKTASGDGPAASG